MVWELKGIRLRGEKVKVLFRWDLFSMVGWLNLDQDIVGLWFDLHVIKKINWVSSTQYWIDSWLLWSIVQVGDKFVGGLLQYDIKTVMDPMEGLERGL